MAQKVGYFENDVVYTEGPFVAVWASGWRIECELKGHHCPVLPDPSIYRLLENELGKKLGKLEDFEEIAPFVDILNEKVNIGEILLVGPIWKPSSYKQEKRSAVR